MRANLPASKSRLPRLLAEVVSAAFLLAMGAGCGGSPAAHAVAAQERTLSEARALELIAEVLADHAIPRGPRWVVPIAGGRELEVDQRLAQSQFGIEWVSAQDRVDFGDALPAPTDDVRLRIIPGAGDSDALILVLEHSTYAYVNEREQVQAGRAGARETEERLRRDVVDFLHFVEGEGGL